ncbi:hypothetical protein QZH41_014292 [Actinostola sp. cb2023]|nr:hypothetical protein QZH41_014292 [Actinostola sp. cb2023]
MSDDRLTREDGERYEPERLPAASTDFKRMDGPWSWIMCVLLLTSTLLQYGCVCTYGILFPEILNEFQSGRAVTEQIFSSRDAIRKAKEAYLITRANTLEPNGLNKRDETY